MEKYNIVNFDDLKDGQYILGFGNHVLRWDFDTMGKPAYGIVPADADDLDKIITALRARLDLAEQVCYALVGQQEHGTAKHRMALDAALEAWKREAVKGLVKGGEG